MGNGLNNITDKHQRIVWVDVIKVFTMFLVVLGHVMVFTGLPQEEFYELGRAGGIYSFHMPLFMMLSGFMSWKILYREGDCMRRFDQLIIPCLTICAIHEITGEIGGPWFLWSCFTCYVLFSILFYFSQKWRYIICVLFVIFIFPLFGLQNDLMLGNVNLYTRLKLDFMLPFFGLGLLLHEQQDFLKRHIIPICVLSGLLWIIMLIFWKNENVYYNSPAHWIDYQNIINGDGKYLHIGNTLKYAYRFFIGMFGSLFWITFVQYLLEKDVFGNYLMRLSKYGKYCLHCYILYALFGYKRYVFHSLGIEMPLDNLLVYLLCSFIYALIETIIYVLIAKVLERNKYINRILFGKIPH